MAGTCVLRFQLRRCGLVAVSRLIREQARWPRACVSGCTRLGEPQPRQLRRHPVDFISCRVDHDYAGVGRRASNLVSVSENQPAGESFEFMLAEWLQERRGED